MGKDHRFCFVLLQRMKRRQRNPNCVRRVLRWCVGTSSMASLMASRSCCCILPPLSLRRLARKAPMSGSSKERRALFQIRAIVRGLTANKFATSVSAPRFNLLFSSSPFDRASSCETTILLWAEDSSGFGGIVAIVLSIQILKETILAASSCLRKKKEGI